MVKLWMEKVPDWPLPSGPTFLPTHLPASSLAPTTTQQPSSNILRHNWSRLSDAIFQNLNCSSYCHVVGPSWRMPAVDNCSKLWALAAPVLCPPRQLPRWAFRLKQVGRASQGKPGKSKSSKWRQAKLGQVQLKKMSVGFSKLNSEVVNSKVEYQLYYEAAQNIRGLGVVHWKASRIWMILQKRIHADVYLQNLSTTAREGVAPPPLNNLGTKS